MNPTKYTTLTGIAVTNEALINAQIARTKAMLETMLGFTLSSDQASENLYNELGKTTAECFCPSVDDENLEPADDVEGAYRLYRYNPADEFFHVDPFTTLYKAKLVFVRPGSEPNGITIKTFNEGSFSSSQDEVRVQVGRDGWAKYIKHCTDCLCVCNDCVSCVQLAVDADWMFEDCLPKDLLYVWADMITYYADCNKDVKSESILTHSYTKFDRVIPELEPTNIATLKRYAGPYGSLTKNPV